MPMLDGDKLIQQQPGAFLIHAELGWIGSQRAQRGEPLESVVEEDRAGVALAGYYLVGSEGARWVGAHLRVPQPTDIPLPLRLVPPIRVSLMLRGEKPSLLEVSKDLPEAPRGIRSGPRRPEDMR